MRIGTRDSALAMRQTEIFTKALERIDNNIRFDVMCIKSSGDLDLTSPLDELESTGAFVRELDDALLRKDIDASVNSLKDVPTSLRNGLTLGAVLARDDPADVILPCRLEELPEGATVGTSSVRRRSLLHYLRPDLKIKNLRGNIQTRLDKLDCDKYDAIILAKAGLDRMGIERSAFRLDPQIFIPAPAQGAIAIECRSDDEHTLNLVSSIDDHITRIETGAEREIMRIVEAGCSSPIGIYAKEENGALRITGVSFADGIEPTRINCLIPMNYTEIDLIAVADSLRGASR